MTRAHLARCFAALSCVLVVLGSGCGGEGATPPQPPPVTAYSASIHTLTLEVAYAPGAEPYTGPLAGFGDTWSLFNVNAARLFQGSHKVIEVPTTLAAMEPLPPLAATSYTTEQVVALAQQYRTRFSTPDSVSYYVVFLNGYYNDGFKVRTDVPGASFGTTGVIAIFKPVIVSATAGAADSVPRIVEQSILIHEFGHATGLVNNTLAMTSDHQDTAHGLHCNNPACIMYYANEGVAEAVQFAMQYARTDNPILWGDECLADAAEGVRTGR